MGAPSIRTEIKAWSLATLSLALGACQTPSSLAAPAPKPVTPVTIERFAAAMGTSISLEIEAKDRPTALALSERALRAVEDCEARISTWRPDSELSGLIAQSGPTPIRCSPALTSELTQALDLAAATNGAFDPSVGPLVQAYDLRGAGRIPTDAQLHDALRHVGYAALEIEADGIRLRPGSLIEEGGFGKGAALDAAREALNGQASVAISLGGQVLWIGEHSRAFPLAHPDQRDQSVLEIELQSGESLATSGNSEGARPHPAGPIGHLLDPRSGRPAVDFGSVSVIATSALAADALSTGLFAMGPAAALAFSDQHPGIEVLVLSRESGRLGLQYSPGLKHRIRILSSVVTTD